MSRTLACLFVLTLFTLTPLWAQLPPPPEDIEQPSADQPTTQESDPEAAPTEEQVKEVLEAAKGDLGEEAFKIVVQGAVDLNYVFAESPDTFVITYKFRIEGEAKNQVDLIKGNVQMTTGIEGFLAKWPTGECALNVSVGEFPFEIVFNKVEEELVRLDIRLVGEILENWESNCTFIDAPGSKFHTSGTPEKWVMRALQRPLPAFTDLTIPIDRLHKNTSTMEFKIESFLIPDPPLGSAELQGKGKIQVIPTRL